MKYRFRLRPTRLFGIDMPWFCDRLDEVDGIEQIVETYELGDLVRPMNIKEELDQKKAIYRIEEFRAVPRSSYPKDEVMIGVFWAIAIDDPEKTKVKFGVEQLRHVTALERLAAEAPWEGSLNGDG